MFWEEPLVHYKDRLHSLKQKEIINDIHVYDNKDGLKYLFS